MARIGENCTDIIVVEKSEAKGSPGRMVVVDLIILKWVFRIRV
jgi:hypothetical protein